LKLQVAGFDTLLPYQFNCSVPKGLVPTFYAFYKNIICLIKGAGQNYREFTICYLNDSKLVIKKYETALATDLRSDIVVYQNYSNPENILAEHIKTGSKKTFIIPLKYRKAGIASTLINNGDIELRFSDGQLLILKLDI
jgi:hypothetical protein